MSGLIKRTWMLALVVTLAAGCAGNANLPNPQDLGPAYESLGKATYSPVTLNYAVDNPLTIIEIKSDRNSQWRYFQISGLKDKAVESRINEEIQALFEQMLPYAMGKKVPPYRGLGAAVQGETIFSHGYLNISPQFNCNNVLSVYARVSGTYKSLPHTQVDFAAVETLNFDLTTGQTFFVEDVFVNDVDALALINACIAEEIRRRSMEEDFGWYRNLSLVSPFKGIPRDQKFYLDNYGLNLVLDYKNPEFDLGFIEAIVTIPFKPDQGEIAIAERFYDKDEYVYINEIVGKRFFLIPFPRKVISETRAVNGIVWNVVYTSPQEVSNVVKDIADSSWQSDKSRVLGLSGIPVTHVEQSFHASYTGEYINVSCAIHISTPDQYYWEEKYIVCTPQGKVLKLEDVFSLGFDYVSIVQPALARAAKEQGLSGNTDRALMDQLTFKLDADRISFIAITESYYPVFFDIPYAEVGCDNLTIFP